MRAYIYLPTYIYKHQRVHQFFRHAIAPRTSLTYITTHTSTWSTPCNHFMHHSRHTYINFFAMHPTVHTCIHQLFTMQSLRTPGLQRSTSTFSPCNRIAHLTHVHHHTQRHAMQSHTSGLASTIVSHLHMLTYVLCSVLTPCCSLPSCSLPSLPTLSLAHCVRSISHLVHAERVRQWGGKHLVARARRHLQGGEATVERSTLGRQVCNS